MAEATQGDRPHAPGVLPAQRRAKTTARSVIIADKVADWTIRIGGIGVIVAVFGIMVFLAQTVVPLLPPRRQGWRSVAWDQRKTSEGSVQAMRFGAGTPAQSSAVGLSWQ